MSHKFTCWSCKRELTPFERGKIPFRATCEFCGADLHVCKNCRFWAPGKPNECLVPGTEWISDREKSNLCEEFKVKEGDNDKPGPSKDDVSKRLFIDND